jgi:hypothetical protein
MLAMGNGRWAMGNRFLTETSLLIEKARGTTDNRCAWTVSEKQFSQQMDTDGHG